MFNLIEQGDMEAIVSYLLLRMGVVLICWAFVFVANFVDFCSGRNTAKALGEKLDSKGYRRTFVKIGDYYRVLIFALLFDLIGSLFVWYKLPFVSMLGSIAVIAIEFVSVIENSQRKSSPAAKVPDKATRIIQFITSERGSELLNKLSELIDDENNNTR